MGYKTYRFPAKSGQCLKISTADEATCVFEFDLRKVNIWSEHIPNHENKMSVDSRGLI